MKQVIRKIKKNILSSTPTGRENKISYLFHFMKNFFLEKKSDMLKNQLFKWNFAKNKNKNNNCLSYSLFLAQTTWLPLRGQWPNLFLLQTLQKITLFSSNKSLTQFSLRRSDENKQKVSFLNGDCPTRLSEIDRWKWTGMSKRWEERLNIRT